VQLEKIESNSLFETIVETGLNPAEFSLRPQAKWPGVVHETSGSYFFLKFDLWSRAKYQITTRVGEGRSSFKAGLSWDDVIKHAKAWCEQVKAPDLWANLDQAAHIFAGANQSDRTDNSTFTQDEQKQITAQLQKTKNQLKEKFELTDEQMTHITERLDEVAEASERIGRKDWLLLFGGTIFNLIVTDTVTPGVAGHIFTTVIHGLMHLFTGAGGPPQILS